MKYENIESLKANRDSKNEDEKINALLSIVLNGDDYDYAMKNSIEFANDNSEWIKCCGIICFGHIARIYKKIDLEKVIEIIKRDSKTENKNILGKIESAVDDITHFLNVERKIFTNAI